MSRQEPSLLVVKPIGQRRLLLGAALLLTVALSPARALADAYEAALTRAVAAKEVALDSNDPASWEIAVTRFQEVRAVAETKEVMYELGYAASRVKQDDLAVEAYRVALELGLDGAPRKKAEHFVRQHERDMAELSLEGPAGAELLVADRRRGTLPMDRPLVLFAGEVLLRVRLPDGQWGEHRFRLEAGESKSFRLKPPGPEPAPSPLPSVSSTSTPATSAENQPAATSQPTLTKAAPPTETPASDGGAAATVLLWSGLGLTVASAVSIPLFGSRLQSARRDLREHCPAPSGDDCPEAPARDRKAAQDAVDSIETYKAARTAGWVGVGVGAALAITGLSIGWFSNESSGTTAGAQVTPGGAQLWLGGRFQSAYF